MTTVAPPHIDRPADVDDMFVIHRAFRREVPALAHVVRGVRTATHVRTAAGHLDLVLAGLHMHHSGEDAIVWPLLTERCPEAIDLIRTLESQHDTIARAADAVGWHRARWVAMPVRSHRDELATAIDELTDVLLAHLDLEEREGVPLMRRSLTAAEWDQVGEHGRSSMSSKQLPLLFGMLLEDADPQEATKLEAELPRPVRLFLRTAGARRYRRYIAEVRSIAA